MEFQKRNAPHFHIFFTIPPDRSIQPLISELWCRISGQSSDLQALAFHSHSTNWIDWEMKTSGYLTKYLDKSCQKLIPEGYSNFGRFWGCSRDLVPEPIIIPTGELKSYDQFDEKTGEIVSGENFILRSLGRLAERKTKGYSRFRNRAFHSSYTMHDGARAFYQLEKYLYQLKRRKQDG
jgi:hypothetical protein